ncbi:MAG: exodeoxyribonuclease VII small subunit [Chloroflexota bacterium]
MQAEDQGLDGLTFEQAYAELEQAVSALQRGQLSLDDTLRLYERGSRLARYCQEKLDGVELKVTQLLSHPNGTYSTRPIASEKDVQPPEAPSPQRPPDNRPESSDAQRSKEQRELFE